MNKNLRVTTAAAAASAIIFAFIISAAPLSAEGEQSAGRDRAKKTSVGIETGVDRYYGYTKYQIGGNTSGRMNYFPYWYPNIKIWFPLSELKFPMETWMVYGKATLNYSGFMTIEAGFKKSVSPKTGHMEDTDWTLSGIQTIYSESTARMDAVISHFDALFTAVEDGPFSLRLGLGFMHQYFDFICSNVAQVDASNVIYGKPVYFDIIGGRTLTYELKYFIPHLSGAMKLSFFSDSLDFNLGLKYSPFNCALDKDDHILRARMSRDRATGYATVMTLFKVKYRFDSGVFLTAGFDYTYILMKGTQRQYNYPSYFTLVNYLADVKNGSTPAEAFYMNFPGLTGKIDNRLECQQIAVSLGAGYSFEL